MRNRMFSLLLTLCLAVYLLPVKAMAAASASVTLAGQTLSVSAYDTPAYYVNPGSEEKASADNWSATFIWENGDESPTLYLKAFTVDDTKQTGIVIPTGQALRIVITEDSRIDAQFGIVYKSDLEIISEADAKLTICGLSGAVTSGIVTGCKLTVDANLDLSVKAYYDASSHILQTNGADLTINGGDIKISTEDEKSLFGIVTRNAGNIIINGGNLEVTSSIGAAPANGSVHAGDKLMINGGTIKATAKAAVPLYAKKGIEISGGLVEITGPYYGINAGTPDAPADISIKGGTVKIAANRAFFTYPILGEGVFAYAGADEESAKIYDGSLTALAKQPWMLISNDSSLKKATEPTAAPTTAPTEPATIAPTTGSTSAPTTIPATAPSEAPAAPSTQAPTEPGKNTSDTPPLLLWLAIPGVIGLVGLIVTLIIFRRKK